MVYTFAFITGLENSQCWDGDCVDYRKRGLWATENVPREDSGAGQQPSSLPAWAQGLCYLAACIVIGNCDHDDNNMIMTR